MKKSLIALAVAGVFVAPAAMAEVTISGAINVGINVGKRTDGDVAGSGLTNNSLSSGYSNINISSVDDIGNGNKVIFNYSMNLEGDRFVSTNNAMGSRNSYLGIAGNWGAFKMGTNENVYERHMYQADPMDGALGPGGNLNLLGTPGGGTIFDAGQAGCGAGGGAGCAGFYRRSNHTIWYESPNFNGFTFEVDYTLSAYKEANGVDPKILSIGGKYAPDGMPFYVDVAYEKHEDMFGANSMGVTGGSSSDDDAFQIGVGYTFGDATLHARYEKLSYETNNATSAENKYERDAYWFGLKYNLPSGYIGAEIGIADEGETNLGDVNDSGATMFGIGYFHNLSKQSQLQFIYGRTDNDSAASYGHAGAPGVVSDGADFQVFHVGIKHTF